MIAARWRAAAAGLRPRSKVASANRRRIFLVALEPGRADERERLDHVLHKARAIGRRNAEQHLRRAQLWLAGGARAGAAHDRHERADTVGMLGRDRLGDHRPHRRTHHVRPLDPEVIEQPDHVERHVLERVAGRALIAPATAARSSAPEGHRARSTARRRDCRSGRQRSRGREALTEPADCNDPLARSSSCACGIAHRG